MPSHGWPPRKVGDIYNDDGRIALVTPNGQVDLVAAASDSEVLRSHVVMTHADFLALPTSPIVIVPAPGAGKLIVPRYSLMHVDTLANAYTFTGDNPQQPFLVLTTQAAQDAHDIADESSNTFGFFLASDGSGTGFNIVYDNSVLDANAAPAIALHQDNWSFGIQHALSTYVNSAILLAARGNRVGNSTFFGDYNGTIEGGDPSNTFTLDLFYTVVAL